MASTDLSPRRIALEEQHADERRAVAERLSAEAETADLARAHEIMVQTAAIKDVLERTRQPLEDARAYGKTSVEAARRVGRLLGEVSNATISIGRRGSSVSPRGLLYRELGMSGRQAMPIVRLGRIPDPDFQRYIQRVDIIPSIYGALAVVGKDPSGRATSNGVYRDKERRGRLLKRQPNPSLDVAYDLIGQALRHVDSLIRNGDLTSARSVAAKIARDALYEAEDALKPYRAGY